MKTAIQEMIDWTIQNAFNLTGEDGTSYIAIDHEEMRLKFDEWLELELKQIVDATNENLIVIKNEVFEFVENESYEPCNSCDLKDVDCSKHEYNSAKCSHETRFDCKDGNFKLKNK